jgi:hypothetical protein
MKKAYVGRAGVMRVNERAIWALSRLLGAFYRTFNADFFDADHWSVRAINLNLAERIRSEA